MAGDSRLQASNRIMLNLRLTSWLLLLFLLPLSSLGQWQTITNFAYKVDASNDGDSFHVTDRDGREFIFRLYFVDACEKSVDSQTQPRVDDQAEYFGVTERRVFALGENAAKFTESKLRNKQFKVVTAWTMAMGRSKLQRYYAFVVVDGKDLGESLVAEGLARVYGEKSDRPGGLKKWDEQERLQKIEAEAKRKKVGAWVR